MDKQSIRRQVYEARKKASDEQIHRDSMVILQKLLKEERYRSSGTVFAYIDCRPEVETRDFIRSCWQSGRKVAVPRVAGKAMNFYYISSFDELKRGSMNIPEPDGQAALCADDQEDALILMPGVAFDRERNRIGYGGGYYDRYLALHPAHPTIAAAFSFQLFDHIPSHPFDRKTDRLITEKDIF